MLPVAKESEEQLRDGAAAVVRLKREEGRRGKGGRGVNRERHIHGTGDYAEVRKREKRLR